MVQATWTLEKCHEIFTLPFFDLVYQAHTILRENFPPNVIQLNTLLSIKTGGCPEDCCYCSQSARYKTGVQKEPLMSLEEVIEKAERAKKAGSTRFCMGASGRGPKDRELENICKMIEAVKAMGMETCVTLGLLKDYQAEKLKAAGLDYYNHNVDTSPEYYDQIISTRSFEDRLETLQHVRNAGIKVCCGGILGMGEANEDRIKMLMVLANLPEPPESVPLNHLIPIPGTPLENIQPIDSFDFIRTIALARIMMPKSYVRLAAGRDTMTDEMQALCFFAGANSIFYGSKLLTEPNPTADRDDILLQKLGVSKMAS